MRNFKHTDPRNKTRKSDQRWAICQPGSVLLLLLGLLMPASMAAAANADPAQKEALTISLYPPRAFLAAVNQAEQGIAFSQAVPIEQGLFQPEAKTYELKVGEQQIPAAITPARLWPDGSVRLLRVQGVWPVDLPTDVRVQAAVLPVDQAEPLPTSRVAVTDGGRIRITGMHSQVWDLHIEARVTSLLRDKQVEATTDPDYWDQQGQYHWAQPLDAVSDAKEVIELSPTIHDHAVVAVTPIHREHVIRGTGDQAGPGRDLEWTLRVIEYLHTPTLEMTMTWKVFWDPAKYALTQASTRLSPSSGPLGQVQIPDLDWQQATEAHAWTLYAGPDARWVLSKDGADRGATEIFGDATRRGADVWLVQSDGHWVGIGLPRGTRLGPSHVAVSAAGIDIASWSDHAGLVQDLRTTAGADEFGMSGVDLRYDAGGVGFSRRFSLNFASQAQAAQAAAQIYADYDQYWFASRDDFVRTQAVEPWRNEPIHTHADYLDGQRANIHFVLQSRLYWRWTGLLNYGDMRTNFAIGSAPDRGLYPMRWAMYGRYGWRNGSGNPHLGLFKTGLYLEDREILKGALDNVLHVVDVDMRQPRDFGEDLPYTGGFHRRNKDHWSGSIQVQYTPSAGVYLAYWLTGEPRLREAAQAIRGYVRKHGCVTGSILSASAWINHYAQTHDPEALKVAEELFDHTVLAWEQRHADTTLSGPVMLYYQNFRREREGYDTLIEFYEATGDRRYLNYLHQSILAHEPVSPSSSILTSHVGPAYLLAHGYRPEDLGQERIAQLQADLRSFMPDELPDYQTDDYEALVQIITAHLPPVRNPSYRETAAIGNRARIVPMVLSWIGQDLAAEQAAAAE